MLNERTRTSTYLALRFLVLWLRFAAAAAGDDSGGHPGPCATLNTKDVPERGSPETIVISSFIGRNWARSGGAAAATIPGKPSSWRTDC
jgi:hypothetical protein